MNKTIHISFLIALTLGWLISYCFGRDVIVLDKAILPRELLKTKTCQLTEKECANSLTRQMEVWISSESTLIHHSNWMKGSIQAPMKRFLLISDGVRGMRIMSLDCIAQDVKRIGSTQFGISNGFGIFLKKKFTKLSTMKWDWRYCTEELRKNRPLSISRHFNGLNYNEQSILIIREPLNINGRGSHKMFLLMEHINDFPSENKGSDEMDANDLRPNEQKAINAGFYEKLPTILSKTSLAFDRKGDQLTVLMGSLVVMSGLLNKTYGIYDNEMMYPNLYLFVVGRASSGKGKLSWSKKWINRINEILSSDGNEHSFLIPANNSAEGFLELLARNQGVGLLFETEGDTIANTLKKDYGNYSHLLREAYHHEEISSYRKTNDQLVRIEFPKLSVVLSGTPNQVLNLIPNPENGLFSRFIFHSTEQIKEFVNVFSNGNGAGIKQIFIECEESFANQYSIYCTAEERKFRFSKEQELEFLELLSTAKSALVNMVHADLDATANRMGCNFFRIAMILTQLRAMENGNTLEELVCSDQDFELTTILVSHLVNEAVKVFDSLPSAEVSNLSTQKFNIYQSLPQEFTTAEAKRIGEQNEMSGRNIQRFLGDEQLFEKLKQGSYRKKVDS